MLFSTGLYIKYSSNTVIGQPAKNRDISLVHTRNVAKSQEKSKINLLLNQTGFSVPVSVTG